MSSPTKQKFIRKTLVISASLLSLFTYPSLVLSAPPTATQTQSSSESDQEVIADEKSIYPIAERIIRANGLDEYPWRIKIEEDYDDNAFARDLNQIIILKGLLDKVAGDQAAIAFIIGHEIAHHTQLHTYNLTAFEEKLAKRLQAEADTEVQNLIATETKKFHAYQNTNRRRKSLCKKEDNAQNTSLASSEYRVLNCQGKPDADKLELIKQEILTEKREQLESAVKKLSRQQELEADKFGYMYMVRAGYDPKGALRIFNLMARGPYVDDNNSSHPSFMERISAVKELMKKYPASNLADEGAIRLRQNPTPLTFDVSRDGESLRINSRFSSQPNSSQTDN
ncbi:peptidase M48 Ste24p [Calothrix sp. NIES-2100]|uniref:M48 family metallopeptidase n=1 Tax=Calothrix sp. NIES-2100 TaxID=1954172 RepID=UPI000B5EE9D0|nr:peptidase M48 Ste24p [Calothrix sp. NIES-2100]